MDALFAQAGSAPDSNAAPDRNAAAPTDDFLRAFAAPTGGFQTGPIQNLDANLLPTRVDAYRDSCNTNDFRLGNGLGVSRPFRKPDSQPAATGDGFHGWVRPTKNFGRSDRNSDANMRRVDAEERASMHRRPMGSKDYEVPEGMRAQEWVYNNQVQLGVAGGEHQYNRNTPMPDASKVARRGYEPAPSRRSKLASTDVETAALRPNSTRYLPLQFFEEDHSRDIVRRVPRNTDVREAVIYESAPPRGMGPHGGVAAPVAHPSVDAQRRPIGTNETGDRSVLGIWTAPRDTTGGVKHLTTNEDFALLHRDEHKYIRGHDLDYELGYHTRAAAVLDRAPVRDPALIRPREDEFVGAAQRSGSNGPLQAPRGNPTYF